MKALTPVLILVSMAAADGILLVNITGFESDAGQAVLALFTEEEWGFPPDPDNAALVYRLDIVDQAVNTEIGGVPEGNYIALAFHDANENGDIDASDEPMGTSCEPEQANQGGPPQFSEMCFSHEGAASSLNITVRKMTRPGGAPGGGGPRGSGRPF